MKTTKQKLIDLQNKAKLIVLSGQDVKKRLKELGKKALQKEQKK